MSRSPPRAPNQSNNNESNASKKPKLGSAGNLSSAFSSHQSIASLASHASTSNSITLVTPAVNDDSYLDASLSLPPPSTEDDGRGKVLILYTGGTMGMKPAADGSLAPERGYLTQKIMEMEEMRNISMPNIYIKEYKELIGKAASVASCLMCDE